jgi:cyclic pyranopterin phosphate synthase
MPAEGIELTPNSNLLTHEEILRLSRLFVQLGVSKIRLTGGEPLVYPKIEEICSEIGATPGVRQLAMTTNGLLLSRKIEALAAAGVRTVNISLDTMQEDKFEFVARRNGLKHVLRAIDAALEHNLETKVNCVVMKGINDSEIADFIALTKDKPIAVRFIEFMPFSENKWNDNKFCSYESMIDTMRAHYPSVQPEETCIHDTAKQWRVPGHKGTVGFITSMSDHFCGGCNRLRLMADGNFKVCLFGEAEVNLKQMIAEGASDLMLEGIIREAVSKKHYSHGGHADMYAISQGNNRSMIRIGG